MKIRPMVILDDDIQTEPVYRNMVTDYTYQVELSYLVRENPEAEKDVWISKSLFLASLPGASTESVWKPLDHPGVRGFSRPQAADCIQRLIEATLIQDFDSITYAEDLRWPMLKVMAVCKGMHYWTYGMDSNIAGEPRGLHPRVALYNLVGVETRRERIWDILIDKSQPFEVRFVDRDPVIIEHANKKDK